MRVCIFWVVCRAVSEVHFCMLFVCGVLLSLLLWIGAVFWMGLACGGDADYAKPWFVSGMTGPIAASMRRLGAKSEKSERLVGSLVGLLEAAEAVHPGRYGLAHQPEADKAYLRSMVVSMIPVFAVYGCLVGLFVGWGVGTCMGCCNPRAEKPACGCCCWGRRKGQAACRWVLGVVFGVVSLFVVLGLVMCAVGLFSVPWTLKAIGSGLDSAAEAAASASQHIASALPVFEELGKVLKEIGGELSGGEGVWHAEGVVENVLKKPERVTDNPFAEGNKYWTLGERAAEEKEWWAGQRWRGRTGWTVREVLEAMEETASTEGRVRFVEAHVRSDFEKRGFVEDAETLLEELKDIRLEVKEDENEPLAVKVEIVGGLTSEQAGSVGRLVEKMYGGREERAGKTRAEAEAEREALREESRREAETMSGWAEKRVAGMLLRLKETERQLESVNGSKVIVAGECKVRVAQAVEDYERADFGAAARDMSVFEEHMANVTEAVETAARVRADVVEVLHRLRCGWTAGGGGGGGGEGQWYEELFVEKYYSCRAVKEQLERHRRRSNGSSNSSNGSNSE
eukprot:MONOS_16500.2-p1 / transcript=MONOS_16500.2 / gene=MONOS_16500 / organism=Monocercomonoides_exilis_PA203 / gene_product=unspecified product / transcript_product=unspecified product / location=Mono_scaffold01795:2-2204(-) / protein_length=568 / sequence_SO=supercontig / SO=protein_coding / is_pseudo=false